MYQMLYVLAFWVSRIIVSSASGVLLHIEVQRRAMYNLDLPLQDVSRTWHRTTLPLADWMEDSRAYTQAGAFFPDFGYHCLAADDEAEAAHWPPFLATAISYLLDTYPDLHECRRGQELLSFILGFAAHQNTDATWHSIKFTNGFLRVMADLDFEGDYSKAHSVLDIGADTILAKVFVNAQNSKGFAHLSESWMVPIDDILKIYERLKISLNPIKLRYCMTRGFAALSAIRRFGSTLADRYQSQSPFMTLHLDDYYLGSLEEASTSTVNCWLSVENWLITGQVPARKEAWGVCEPMATIGRRGKAGPYAGDVRSKSVEHEVLLSVMQVAPSARNSVNFDDLISQEMETIRSVVDVETGLLNIVSTRGYGLDDVHHLVDAHQDSYFLTPSISYSEFGSSVTLLETQGTIEIVVGSPKESDLRSKPSRGSVYVVPIESKNGRHYASSLEHSTVLQTEISPSAGSDLSNQDSTKFSVDSEFNLANRTDSLYFGRSVANLSIGGDQCLAILSSKRVEIFRYINGSLELNPSTTIYNHGSEPFSAAPIANHVCSFIHAGQSVLAVASPWSGRRASGIVYLFSSARLDSRLLPLSSADLIIKGTMTEAYNRLGSTIAYSNKHSVLLVGSAGGRSVTGFAINLKQRMATSILKIMDPSKQRLNTGFGSSGLLIRGDYVYVGSMSEDFDEISQVGAVRVFQIATRIMVPDYATLQVQHRPYKAKFSVMLLPQQATAFANFGSQIVAAEHFKGVYISSPGFELRGGIYFVSDLRVSQASESTMFWPSRQHRQILQSYPKSQHLRIAICALGYETNAKFGATLAVSTQGHVVVSAPLASGLAQEQRLAGKVYYFEHLSC